MSRHERICMYTIGLLLNTKKIFLKQPSLLIMEHPRALFGAKRWNRSRLILTFRAVIVFSTNTQFVIKLFNVKLIQINSLGTRSAIPSCCHWWWSCCCCHCSGSFYTDNVVQSESSNSPVPEPETSNAKGIYLCSFVHSSSRFL